jgi:outer membrane lipoprotein-sorting protein
MAILVLLGLRSGTDTMHSGKTTTGALGKGTSRPGLPVAPLTACVAFALLLFGHAPALCAQTFLPESAAPIATTSTPRTLGGLAANDIIAKMTEKNRQRNQRLQNYSALRHYEIVNATGQVSAQALVRVNYSAPGNKTFEKINEDGSWIARRMVFDRVLQSEEATSSGQEFRESAITAENYTFTAVGEADLGNNHCYVIEVQPKRADKYLFAGEVWIDSSDFAIVKISGRPAGKMSMWINRATFIREYQRIDGFWLPYRDETTVDLKMHGTKLFRIEHLQYVINSKNNAASTATALPQHN